MHCYEYGRRHPEELKRVCKEVHYYKRNLGIPFILRQQPYIVVTRNSKALLRNLQKNPYPILFEGLHTTALINDAALSERTKIVRTHNVEHEYYSGLYQAENKTINKQFFRMESSKLKKYEPVLMHADHILAISESDYKYFSSKYNNVSYIPAFHPNFEVSIKEGTGNFVLYHGNLSVPENIAAVYFLITEVFSKIDIPLVIAGKNPESGILKIASKYPNIKIIKNPDRSTMQSLISEAQINILTSFQDTGIKLKLISALFSGRHCIVNSTMVKNSGLENLCIIKNSPATIIKAVKKIYKQPFTSKNIQERKAALNSSFSNSSNAIKICEIIY